MPEPRQPLSSDSGDLFESDEDAMRFICAAKGLPYTATDWEREVLRLDHDLTDARERLKRALAAPEGVCVPERYDR